MQSRRAHDHSRGEDDGPARRMATRPAREMAAPRTARTLAPSVGAPPDVRAVGTASLSGRRRLSDTHRDTAAPARRRRGGARQNKRAPPPPVGRATRATGRTTNHHRLTGGRVDVEPTKLSSEGGRTAGSDSDADGWPLREATSERCAPGFAFRAANPAASRAETAIHTSNHRCMARLTVRSLHTALARSVAHAHTASGTGSGGDGLRLER